MEAFHQDPDFSLGSGLRSILHLERIPFGDFVVGYQCDRFDLGGNILWKALRRGNASLCKPFVLGKIDSPLGRIVTPQDRFRGFGPSPVYYETQASKDCERFWCQVGWTAAVRGTNVRPKTPSLIGLPSGTSEMTVTEKVALGGDPNDRGSDVIPAWQNFRYFGYSERGCSAKYNPGLPEFRQSFATNLVRRDEEVLPGDGWIARQILRKELDDRRGPPGGGRPVVKATLGLRELRSGGRLPFHIAVFGLTDHNAASERRKAGVVEHLSQRAGQCRFRFDLSVVARSPCFSHHVAAISARLTVGRRCLSIISKTSSPDITVTSISRSTMASSAMRRVRIADFARSNSLCRTS